MKHDAKAGDYCKKMTSNPYNWELATINIRNKFYCSHHIYKEYLDECHVNLNTYKFDGRLSNDKDYKQFIHQNY